MKNDNKLKGFTLLEILLVIAVIGILAAIVLVAINPNRQLAQARNLQRKSDIDVIYNALEMYTIRNRGAIYPGINFTPKEICNTGAEQEDGAANCEGKLDLRSLVPTYITSIPTDPQGLVYQISRNLDNNSISITAPSSELGQTIAINPPPPATPEELIQNQITVGTLIPTGTQQLVLNRLVYKNNAGTQTYIDPATTTKVCPTGYIAVPGNSMYGVTDFCVMKYEAKAVDVSNPTVGLTTPNTGFNTIANDVTSTTSASTPPRAIASVASGFPIARISQPTAASYCSTAGASLITNAEWMTIARNIEGQLSNWTTGTAALSAIGTGGLYRGHSDNSPANALAANTDDNQGYEGTGNTSPSIERRTHILSNGETIWDLSGNAWEWTSDTISGLNRPNTNSGGLYQEWTTIINFKSLSYDLTRPSNTDWNSTQNMGQYYAGNVTGTILSGLVRGGRFAADGGIYAMFLANQPSNTVNDFGFRCVVR